jgi:hypothetical protein
MSGHEHEGLTPEELESQTAELIPEREAMTVIQPISPFGGGVDPLPDELPSEE